jgi:hypothetical protein
MSNKDTSLQGSRSLGGWPRQPDEQQGRKQQTSEAQTTLAKDCTNKRAKTCGQDDKDIIPWVFATKSLSTLAEDLARRYAKAHCETRAFENNLECH